MNRRRSRIHRERVWGTQMVEGCIQGGPNQQRGENKSQTAATRVKVQV